MSKKKQKVVKGMPSAVLLSIVIHAALFLLAGMLVVFTVVKKEEKKFEPPKAVERPKMKLKKPKVRMKKSSRPKSRTRIVTRSKRSNMPNIELPEMSGMGDGLGDGLGADFGMMPNLEDVSVFGSAQSIGNDFEGSFYSLKYNRQRKGIPMDRDQFLLTIRRFCTQGWNESILAPYYRAPDKLYTTHFMVPEIPAPLAPDVFNQPEMESYWFFVKYKGQLVYPEDIKFRFWGVGDAYAIVRVDGKNVFINGVPNRLRVLDFWQSTSGGTDTYRLGYHKMKISEWIELKAGEPVDMEVLYGEWEGGSVACMLLVEVDGVEYPKSSQGGPLLPAFKTAEFTQDQLEEIRKHLAPHEASLTNGPVFRDYTLPAGEAASTAETEEPEPEEQRLSMAASVEPERREWALKDGQTIKAEFIAQVGSQVTLKNMRGKQFNLHEDQFSDEDLSHIALLSPPNLELEFSRKSRQREFPDTHTATLPTAFFYNFKARIKQASTRYYPHELTAEFFAIADEIDGNNMILLDYKKEPFHLSEGSGSVIEIEGDRTVQLMDYYLRGYHRGEKYKGYLVVITDIRGEVVAYKATSEYLYTNLENLRKVPVGKYFDKDCNRCTPTRPHHYF